MRDLQLIGVHEDGEHLLLCGADDARFRIPVDESLRAAIRRDRPHLGQVPVGDGGGLRPRDVQALIRAGASSDEVANRAGWSIEKVHRYEGPILAEREHVAGRAQKVRLRTRSGASSGVDAPTLSARVAERLKERGVEATDASWDSWRAEGGPWTVVLTFAAGGRQRQASWSFDLANQTILAVDDEARWLSEEVQEAKGPIPAPLGSSSGRATKVYDVEAEGGLQTTDRVEHPEDPVDLMTAMRKRSTARNRRRTGGHRESPRTTASGPGASERSVEHSAQELPLENLSSESAASETAPLSAPTDAHPEPEPAVVALAQEQGDRPEPAKAAEVRQTPAPTKQPRAQKVRRAGEAARKTDRPSVPAWDEIMFGSKSGADRSSS